MLTSIRIKGFRKYEDFSIENFSRFNYILGNNNVGKTSILESIYAWACGQYITPLLSIPLSRGRYFGIQHPYWIMEEILAIVHDRNRLPLSISFSGVYDGKEECFDHTIYPSELLTYYDSSYKRLMNHSIPQSSGFVQNDSDQIISGQTGMLQITRPIVIAKWDIQHNDSVISERITVPYSSISQVKPFQPAKYVDVLSHTSVNDILQIYSSLKREKLIEKVAVELSRIYPEIIGFDIVPYPDGSTAPISIVKRDGSILPLFACGDGLQRWFYIIGAMELYKNAIICIDEIDTGFHPDAQVEFNKRLVEYARNNNVQLFITTHNIEFVDHFLDAVNAIGKDYEEEARIITVRDIGQETRYRILTAEDAKHARNDYRAELR